MLIRTHDFQSFSLSATDETFGTVSDVYFDSAGEWTVRFIVADTRPWFVGGKVLLNPALTNRLDIHEQTLDIQATKDQVKNSPQPSEHEPISRAYEASILDHYGLNYYWASPHYGPGPPPLLTGGGPVSPFTPGATLGENTEAGVGPEAIRKAVEREQEKKVNEEDYYLQSTKDLRGYTVYAAEDKVGTVSDVIFDVDNWQVFFMEVDTAGFLAKDKYLVPVEWFREFVPVEERAYTRFSDKNIVEQAPDYDESTPLTDDYIAALRHHYGTPNE
ncbi:PRC-barrel domain-containing protein [Natribacillus halophilus]|uniref:PRC-barrel domain-containing protein n=1 Tax=Natribacillus halophilus TaxID=549003 RepID=A0A1G8Q3P7_9BACI|nr:PRC-barrel domain-containing protein [Natribacillus halophilus]SDI99347.1 PRC-barrel domain-containing protein [Natribacillus halophilus]